MSRADDPTNADETVATTVSTTVRGARTDEASVTQPAHGRRPGFDRAAEGSAAPGAPGRRPPGEPRSAGGVAGGGSPPPQERTRDGTPTPGSDGATEGSAAPAPALTAVPCGRFLLEAEVGRGAFGSVWRGRDRESGMPVAVKVVHAEVADAERASLLHEARAVAALEHPRIVRIVDLGTVTGEDAARGSLVAGAPWLAMDLVRGGTLREEVGRVDWPRLKDVLLQLLDALAHAHAAGIVHRDLKPANVLREGARIVVSDFGIAALGGARDELVRGTPAYMAPEQIEGDWRALGPWTDLYSVGCLAWALATGRPPFPGKGTAVMMAQLREAPPDFEPARPMPTGLEAWLRLLLRKGRSERPQFAADAARALEALTAGPSVGQARAGTAPARDWSPATLASTWRHADDRTSVAADVADGERLLALRTLPLVGRVPEREQLWGHLRRAFIRDETLVDVLRGPAGIGKSRLSAWLAQRAHALGAARVVDMPLSVDFLGAAGAAVARSAAADGMAAPDAEVRLTAVFGRHMTRADLSALAELCAPGTGAASASLSQPAWRHALLGRWLRALAAERPVILRIEDAQRDAEALAFAQSLLGPRGPAAERERGLLVLVTVRDDVLGDASPAWRRAVEALDGLAQAGASVFFLGPLEEAEQRALLRAASGGASRRGVGMAPSLAAAVLRHADGNPLYIEQIVRGWAASGAIVQTAEGLRSTTGRVPPLDVDLSSAWARRLDQPFARLPDDERAAVEIAATLGARFETGFWQRACAHAGVAARTRGLDVLVEQRFVARPPGAPSGTFVFMHGGLREALLAGARARGRAQRWHLACARAYADEPQAFLRERAEHLAAAEQHAEALGALADATVQASRRGNEELARELAALRGQVLALGRFPESHPAHGEQLWLEAENALHQERWSVVDTCSARAVELGRAHGWEATVARALLQRARLHRHHGRPADAAAASGEAVARLRRLGDACPTEWLAMALRVRGMSLAVPWLRSEGGEADVRRLDEAMDAVGEARALYASLGDDAGVGHCELGIVTILRARGDLAGARRWLRTARAVLQRAGHVPNEAIAVYDLADIQRMEGDLDAAEAGFREAHALLESVGARDDILETNLALVLVERGRHEEAIGRLEVLRAQCEAIGGLPLLVYIVAALARCRYALGDADGGREAFDATVAILEAVPFANEEVAHHLTQCAPLAFACGHGDVALRAAELGRQLAGSAQAPTGR